MLGSVHILRNTGWKERGLPDLLQYFIGGVLQSLLQYYRFGRNMEGLRPFSVLHIYFYVVLKVRIFSQIWKKNSQICDLGKYPYIISILHRGEFLNLLQYYMGGGGLPNLLQY